MDRPDDSPAVAPEKTSAWTDAEREKAETPPPQTQPVWAPAFVPGAAFTANGWDCVVRAVGEPEPGFWFVMIEPLRRIEVKMPRSVKRAVYKKLKSTIGKKKAKEAVRGRGHSSDCQTC